MILFATPDFGAGGAVICFLGVCWIVVLVFVAIGVLWGGRIFTTGSPRAKKWGLVLMLVSASVPVACCFGPEQVFRINFGRYPISGDPFGKVEKGMTADQVKANLGEPHERRKRNDEETWAYYSDSFGIGDFYVDFDANGRVASRYGH